MCDNFKILQNIKLKQNQPQSVSKKNKDEKEDRKKLRCATYQMG